MNIFYKEAAVASFSLPLNALRGIAACIVVCQHITEQASQANYGGGYYDGPPFNGAAAVTLFFVLSGFVLGISLARKPLTAHNYLLFTLRRIFRIMPLMIVIVTIGGLYLLFVEPLMPVPSVPAEYGPLTPLKFLSAYVGYSMKPCTPIWSIYVELLGSALLPLMVATGRNRALTIILGIALLLFGSFYLGLQHDWNLFLIDFFVGVTVLWWGRPFAERMMRLNTALFWTLLAVLFAIFYLPVELFKTEVHDRFCNLIETAAIAPVIAIVFFCPQRFVGLAARPFRYLGDVSYSIYLTHWVTISIAINLVVFLMPSLTADPTAISVAAMSAAMIAVMLPICLAIAALSYRYIEQPGQAWGRLASAFLQRRLTPMGPSPAVRLLAKAEG
jgi:peptidoglycan/LPS O-acetylase OafA/YrhL